MAFSLGSTFGATTTSAPSFSFSSNSSPGKVFGQSSFGSSATAVTSTPSFGFGSTPSSTGFAGGSTFGGGFGTTFGSGTSTAQTFSFNAPTTTTTTPSLFSGFGQTQTSASGFGGIGVSKPFGTSAPTFGTGVGFGGTTSAFGSSTQPVFGAYAPFGFGTGQSAFGVAGPLGITQQQQAPQGQYDVLLNSIFNVNIYADDRDQILTKWNLLQALWGFGKGYYAQNAPPVEYNNQNIFCRLKGIAYSRKPFASNSDALTAISINRKLEDIRNQQIQFESSVSQILGNKPNITVHVDCVRPLSDIKSLVLIYVQEKAPNGATRRVPNNEVCSYLVQISPKQQLANMGVDNVYPFTSLKEEQLTEYLENPPNGIDAKIWKQAQAENPDPSKFIPVPLIGLNDIKWRFKCQEHESNIQQQLLNDLSSKVSNLQRQQITADARLKQYKQNLLLMEHRILKIFVALSDQPNAVYGPEEEALKARLEDLHATLSKPQYFKNRVAEIVSALRLQDNQSKPENVIDENNLTDLKEFLAMQYKAITNLKEVVDSDTKELDIIQDEIRRFPAIH